MPRLTWVHEEVPATSCAGLAGRRALLVAGFVLRGAGSAAPVAYLTWYGQSCFLLESATGTRVVMDPIPGNIGYLPPADLRADAVTVSHEHADHNNVPCARQAQNPARPHA